MKKAVIQVVTQTAETAFPPTIKLVCKRSAVCILPTSSSRISESSILNGQNLAILVIRTFSSKHFKVKLTSFIKKMQKIRLQAEFGATVLVCAKALNCLGPVLVTNVFVASVLCSYNIKGRRKSLTIAMKTVLITGNPWKGLRKLKELVDHPWESLVQSKKQNPLSTFQLLTPPPPSRGNHW